MKDSKRQAVTDYYIKASTLALIYVEQEARKILTKHPNLDEFIMCMGSYFFTQKKGTTYSNDAILHNPPEYIKNSDLVSFIDEWDEFLKITGSPMRFTATGPVKTNWSKIL